MNLPAGLPALVSHYRDKEQQPVRVRPSVWTDALDADGTNHTGLLSAGVATPGHTRTIDRDELLAACGGELDDQATTCQAFVLMMAWGSGLRANRSLRFTGWALADPAYAHGVLAKAAADLRSVADLESLDQVHRNWRLRGVGQSFFTKWFAFAGQVDGRSWQPLILDRRVYRTLNATLGVTTDQLADSRSRPSRYRAYVAAVHAWAAELRDHGHEIDANRLEWILFAHNGHAVPAVAD